MTAEASLPFLMRRRLEKNYLSFSHVFSANLSYILSNILYRIFPINFMYKTNMWLNIAEKMTQNIQEIYEAPVGKK